MARTQCARRLVGRAADAGNARRSNHRRSAPRCAAARARSDASSTASIPGRPAADRRCRARPRPVCVGSSGHQAAERRDAGAQHVHRVAGGRQLLQHGRAPRPAARAAPRSLRLVGGELARDSAASRAPADGRSPRIRSSVGDVEDVVAAIVQVVAGPAHRAQRGVAGGDAGQRHGFLRLEARPRFDGRVISPSPAANSWSSFAS